MPSRLLFVLPIMLLPGCDGAAPAVPEQRAEAPGARAAAEVAGPERTILAFGDSLFAGYNVDAAQAYPAQLQAALRERGINANVVNAGVSGDTSAAGRARLTFTLDGQEQAPDLAIVELGGNDLLRGLRPSETRTNLDAILSELDRRGIPILLMGMRAPPNLGPDFAQEFDAIYPELAAKYDAELIPFWLESIYDKPRLIQADRVHPTAGGITVLVDNTVDTVARAVPPTSAAD